MMFNPKRTIAALIVCFKPHVFLTLCILLVIAHSIIVAIKRGASNSWKLAGQHDVTLTMTTLILLVALIWATFFIFIVRFELRNELELLLIMFQCSKRGLRFLGVITFHFILLICIATLVSTAVEKSAPADESHRNYYITPTSIGLVEETAHLRVPGRTIDSDSIKAKSELIFRRTNMNKFRASSESKSQIDRDYLLVVYKIWLTAIVYAFTYLVMENLVTFYTDMSLVEFVHVIFITSVAKTTGIDLSDYPAGEMIFNPLIRRRLAR